MSLSEDHMVLAAEYVLGTLDVHELDTVQQLLATDPEFAAAVRDWERRLGELNVMVGAIEPPPDTFDRIRARIGDMAPSAARSNIVGGATGETAAVRLPGEAPALSPLDLRPGADGAAAAEARGEIIDLTRRVRRARQLTGVFALLAAGACALFVTSALRPELLPEPLQPRAREVVRTVEKEVERPADRPNRFVAVLQRDSVSPAFILTVDLDSRTMTVRRVAAEAQPDKSFELWLVSSRYGTPRSLGLVGDSEFTPAKLASFEPDMISDAVYAISLEPTGGSPTGQPTGPVLWTGKLVEALPPSGNP